MTGLLLLAKCTVVLLATAAACVLLRGHAASVRRLVWLTGLTATLFLPLGLWIPQTRISVPLIIVSATPFTRSVEPGDGAIDWFGNIWAAGSAICLLRLLAGIVRTLRMIGAGAPCTDGAIPAVTVPQLAGPAAWGIGRKLVLLPDCVGEWPEERRRMVILHEHAHLVRRDSWALLVAELACAVYWMNPLVWFAATRFRREQEHAADDAVLNSGADPVEYAGHLVAIARADRAPVLAAGAVHESDLSVRVKAILDRRRVRIMTTRKMVIACAAFLVALTFPLVSMQAQRKIYSVKDTGVTAPRLLHKQEPDYTQEAKDAKIQGPVHLSAVIDVDGKAHDVKVDQGLDEGLDANAIAAIENWRFEPAQKDGERVPVAVKIEVNYRLK